MDWEGAPKRTSWSFTFEENLGVVFSQEGKGCPVWYYGNADFQRAYEARNDWGNADFITLGFSDPKLGDVMVLGSADISGSTLSRRMEGHDEYAPFSNKIPAFARPRIAKVPRWSITVNARMMTFVQLRGKDYPTALKAMFDKGGRSG